MVKITSFGRSEKLGGDFLGKFDPFLGEEDGLGLADWIGNQAFFVEAVADVPIEGFPGSVGFGAFLPRVYEKES